MIIKEIQFFKIDQMHNVLRDFWRIKKKRVKFINTMKQYILSEISVK